MAGLEYMLELGKYMPPGSTTWDWSGEADAVAQGMAGTPPAITGLPWPSTPPPPLLPLYPE